MWLLTFLVLFSTIGLGYRQGVIRASFSFVGILFAAMLAVPVGHLLKPLLHFLGHDLENETMAWMVAPLLAFPIVLAPFKVAGGYVHFKLEMNSKHKTGDLEFSIWTRLNHRLGACVGALNGTAYTVLLAFVIFNYSYWSYQVATSESETASVRLLNRLGADAQSTGMNKTAVAVGTLPPDYYRLADLSGLLCQNPGLSARLARYPMFLSLIERDDVQGLINDGEFTNAWATHAPMGSILNEGAAQSVIKNNDLLNTTWAVVEPNMDDLVSFLNTGKSKYDAEPVSGFWDFDPRVTFAYMRLNSPTKISSSEMRAARDWMAQAYASTIMIVAADNQAFLKYWPDAKAHREPNQPQPTINWKGTWSKDGTNYLFTLSDGADNKTFAMSTDGQRLMLKDEKNTYVFDHE
jgi:uncharacterized membrane protein required for colicin V production